PDQALGGGRGRVPQGARTVPGRRLRALCARASAPQPGAPRRGANAPEARSLAEATPRLRARRRPGLVLEVGDERGVATEPPRGAGREGCPIRIGGRRVEGGGVGLPEIEQAVGNRVHDELVVAVGLLGRLPSRRVPRGLGLLGLLQYLGV